MEAKEVAMVGLQEEDVAALAEGQTHHTGKSAVRGEGQEHPIQNHLKVLLLVGSTIIKPHQHTSTQQYSKSNRK